MGLRAHIVTTYKVEYGSTGFKHSADELKNLLRSVGIIVCLNSEDDCYSDWEIERRNFEDNFVKLIRMSEKKMKSFWEYIDYFPGKSAVIATLKNFLETADKSDGWIHIHWF